MKSAPTPTPAPTPAPISALPTWANVAPDKIKPEISAILTEIRDHTASRLPRLAVLRFNATLAKIELAELVKSPDFEGVPRRAWDDSKPFADILSALTPARLPQSAFEALKRSEARELAGLLNEHKKNTAVAAAVEKYLAACKFRAGWSKTVCERIAGALPTPASAETPAISALPPPSPLSAVELVALVKTKLREMPDKQRDAARAMLAALVNDKEKLAERIAA